MKMWQHVLANIILLAIYIYVFGQNSIMKYLKRGVIITIHEEKMSPIDPPGL